MNEVTSNQSDSKQSGNENKSERTSPQKVTIEIVRHRRMFSLLQSPQKLWRVSAFLFWVFVVFIAGLIAIILVVKEIYPYNNISTDLYGSTTLKSESSDVTYWLFNTAVLWANSGMEVKAGDILTIRASGASHTAIHKLSENASSNRSLVTKWRNTEGSSDRAFGELDSKYRRKFRIAPQENEGTLLMQVVPTSGINSDRPNDEYLDGKSSVSDGKIYVIGRERQNMAIQSDGVLFFHSK